MRPSVCAKVHLDFKCRCIEAVTTTDTYYNNNYYNIPIYNNYTPNLVNMVQFNDLNKLDNIFLTFQIACTIQDINVEHSNPLIAVVVEVAVAVLKCPVKTILARITIIIIRA